MRRSNPPIPGGALLLSAVLPSAAACGVVNAMGNKCMAKLKLKADQSWPQPPESVGCYGDHAPQAKAPYQGARLLECGVPACSGQWGCGGKQVGTWCPKKDCPDWPASRPKCDIGKTTIESCISDCLAWSPTFSYAGLANGDECWCDVELNGAAIGGDNPCRHNICSDCKNPCKGDKNQNCGGFWNVNVYRIRPDAVEEVDDASWTLTIVVAVLVLTYYTGGILFGAKRKGHRLREARFSSHPHYSHLAELASLCKDGASFAAVKLGVPGFAMASVAPRKQALLDGDVGTQKRVSHASVSSAKSSKSAKSSSSSKGKKNKKHSKEWRKSGGGDGASSEAKTKGVRSGTAAAVATSPPEMEANDGRQLTQMTDAFGKVLRR